ncbi:hypothetical protein [Microbacterium phyllosphaerae]|uniref:hypothetical protein n=1 Tax=Microbacterium phyllosphaerae TaxID=124798 RepID=UPI002167B944|nr:hypothetical protein [Microbacterium phyllosphaerae]MCS3444426.1 hypothetical protein [Microbacterium phyllosphaerae]
MMQISDRPQRRLVRIAGWMFTCATAVAVAVIAVDWFSARTASVLIGPLDDQILLSAAVLIASVALVMGFVSVSSPTWMLPFKILGILGAAVAVLGAGFSTLWSVDVTMTTLTDDGCDTGYVVVERSLLMGSRGTVYRQDGPIVASPMARTSGNNAHQPFAEGDYGAAVDGEALIVEYRPDPTGSRVTLELPVIADRQPSCGYANTSLSARPETSEPTEPAEVLTPTEVDAEIRRLLDDSFAVTVGTPIDAAGATIDASAASPNPVPCAEGSGVQHHVDLDFRTDDNARSVTQILGVWDDAGYESDEAMQADIRYSETAPVERMTIRDTTSIDGLVRMTLTSACMSAE